MITGLGRGLMGWSVSSLRAKELEQRVGPDIIGPCSLGGSQKIYFSASDWWFIGPSVRPTLTGTCSAIKFTSSIVNRTGVN